MTKKPKYWVRLNRTYLAKDGSQKQVVMLATSFPVIENGFAKFSTENRETGKEEMHLIVASSIEEVNQAKEQEEQGEEP